MWTYKQSDGSILDSTASKIGSGYAGNGKGLNNPDAEGLHDVGPLPRGLYIMQPPVDTDTHGPYVIWLTPKAENEMHGRGAFGIHGGKSNDPERTASKGCICTLRTIREQMWNSGDHLLEVIR